MNKKQKGINNKRLVIIPPVRNYSSRKEWENVCWQRILESKELLQLLITSHERHSLVMRAAALEGLSLRKNYRDISKDFYVSLQTISIVKKAIAENSYRSYLERSKKERKKKKYSYDKIIVNTKSQGRPIRTKYGTIYMPQ